MEVNRVDTVADGGSDSLKRGLWLTFIHNQINTRDRLTIATERPAIFKDVICGSRSPKSNVRATIFFLKSRCKSHRTSLFFFSLSNDFNSRVGDQGS